MVQYYFVENYYLILKKKFWENNTNVRWWSCSTSTFITGYAVSKVGIVRFIESLSHELNDYKIDVNSVAPGSINTDMLNEILKAGPKKLEKGYEKALLQKKEEVPL